MTSPTRARGLRTSWPLALGVACGVAGGVACGGESRPTPEAGPGAPPAANAATGAPAAPAGPGAVSTGPNGCRHDGRWRPCALRERLEKSGLAVAPGTDTVRYAFFSVPGLVYKVGRGEVQGFFYDDSLALARDVAKLDTVRVAPAGTFRHWDAPPTFARSANLVVVILTMSEVLQERGAFAVQAGPPQPEPPRVP